MYFILQQNNKLSVKSLLKRAQIKLLVILLISLSLFNINTSHAIETQQLPFVKKVIQAFKYNDRVALSKLVSYPLLRDAPLEPIKNPNEFLTRYDEVFDKQLLTTITRSNPHTDWDSIGWRGVILNNGILSLDPEGKITEINYQSQRELALANQSNSNRAAKGRRSMIRNVTGYQQSIVEITTNRFHIRVDDVGNGKLRYASWPINKQNSQKPDLVLTNGRIVQNGRNERFVFDNGTYSYQLNVSKQGLSTNPSASLDVFKNGKSWVHEVATKVIRR